MWLADKESHGLARWRRDHRTWQWEHHHKWGRASLSETVTKQPARHQTTRRWRSCVSMRLKTREVGKKRQPSAIITSCMNFLQTGRISFDSVAENIITCFECGVARKISWMSRRISTHDTTADYCVNAIHGAYLHTTPQPTTATTQYTSATSHCFIFITVINISRNNCINIANRKIGIIQ